jgi:transglutaminase-like putative cysteine protease
MKIHYETAYTYPQQVISSVVDVWLRPVSSERQICTEFSLRTSPDSRPRPYADYFGNTVYHLDVGVPHSRVTLTVEAQVETKPGASTGARETLPAAITPAERDRWLDFLAPSALTADGPGVRRLVESAWGEPRSADELLRALAAAIHGSLGPPTTQTTPIRSAEEALGAPDTGCVDYVHVMLALCRLRGYPARFISGYLAEDAVVWHAWLEVYMGNDAWLGYDPTHDREPDARYVQIATGRDHDDVPQVRGAYTSLSGHGLEIGLSALESQQQQ